MRKLFLVACMILVLVGCGKKETETSKNQIIQSDETTDVVNISSKYKDETFKLLNEKDRVMGTLMSDENFMELLDSLIMHVEGGIISLDEKNLTLEDIARIYKQVGNEYELETFLMRYFPDKIYEKEEIRKEYEYLVGGDIPQWGYVRIDRTSLDNDILTVEAEYLIVGDYGDNILVEGYSIDDYESMDEYYEKYDKVKKQIKRDWEIGLLDLDERYILKFIVDKENREFIPIHKQEKPLKMYTEYTQEEMKKIYNSDNKSEEVLIFSAECDLGVDGRPEKIDLISRFAEVYYFDNEYKWSLWLDAMEADVPRYAVRISDHNGHDWSDGDLWFEKAITKNLLISPIHETELISKGGRNKLKVYSRYKATSEAQIHYLSFIDGKIVVETDVIDLCSGGIDGMLLKWNREDDKAIITGMYEDREDLSNADMFDYDYTKKVAIIPEEIGKYKVTEIRKGAFDKCKSEYVVIPESIEKIEEDTIPDGVKILKRAPIFNLETIEMLDKTDDINKLLENDIDLMFFIDLISDNCEDFDINEGISINNISTILEIASGMDTKYKIYDVSKELDELIELYYPDKKSQKDELEKMSKDWFGFDNVVHDYRVVNSKLEGDILTIQYEELHDYEDIGLEDLSDEKSDEASARWKNGTLEADYKAIFKFKVDEENMIFIPIYKKEIYNKWAAENSINE